MAVTGGQPLKLVVRDVKRGVLHAERREETVAQKYFCRTGAHDGKIGSLASGN